MSTLFSPTPVPDAGTPVGDAPVPSIEHPPESVSTDSLSFRRPAFFVGVTGNVDPHDTVLGKDPTAPENIRCSVRRLLQFLKHGAAADKGASYKGIRPALQSPRHSFGLDEWPGLPNTPIVVLTSLAPGADTIVAEEALELGMTVRAFLPFPPELYVNASTFVEDPGHITEDEEADQNKFRELISRIEKSDKGSVHTVLMAGDDGLAEEARYARLLADRDASTKDEADRKPRSYRYQAAGQYIAAHCDLLLALWDDEVVTGKPEGTGGIVEAKLRGITPGLLTAPNAFTWADCGSVAHLYMRRKKNDQIPPEKKVGKIRFLHAADLPEELRGGMETMPRGKAFEALLATLWDVQHQYRGLPRKKWLAYKSWQRNGILFLGRLARNLDTFNQCYLTPEEPARPLCELLDPKLKDAPSVTPPPDGTRSHALFANSNETYHALVPLVAARRCAADESRRLRAQSTRALRIMVLLVFLFAICTHLLSEWELPEEELASIHATENSPAVPIPSGPVQNNETAHHLLSIYEKETR